jgi:SAM-dependent methyltransferase
LPISRSEQVAKHNQTQIRYFAGMKTNMLPADTPYVRRQVEEMIAFAGLRPGDRVLEVGCGMGRYTMPLLRSGLNVEGLDLSPFLLEQLRIHAPLDLKVYNADIMAPPAELEGKFDAVVGFFTLHHLHDMEHCFSAMATLVRPGGTVAFLEPNAFNPLYYVQVTVTPGMTWEGDRGIVRMRRKPVFRAMQRAGLESLRVHRFGFFPPFLSNSKVGGALEQVIERIVWRKVLPFQIFAGAKATL